MESESQSTNKASLVAQSMTDEEVRDAVNEFRMSSIGASLTNELKEEYRSCLKYCKKRREENWQSRNIASGVQGVSGEGRQERMKLPTIVELEIEKRFGKGWHSDKEAHQWAWDNFPEFRLIEEK